MSNDDLGWREGEYGMEPMYPAPEQQEPNICNVDFDNAFWLGGDEEGGADGVYFDAAEEDGKWYMSAVVDSDTGGFCDALVTDDGPHHTYSEAMVAGLNAAAEWCGFNNVDYGRDYERLFDYFYGLVQEVESPTPGWVTDPNFDNEEPS